jgi:hypothetical protein
MSRTGFRPNFDTLEAREVPAVSIYSMDGGRTLKIVGSKDSDEIRIVQDDTNDTLEIYSAVLPKSELASVSSVGVQTFTSSTVKKLVIDLGVGNDAFYYSLAEGSDLNFTKTITLNTGSGNDLVRFETASPRQNLDEFYRQEALRSAEEAKALESGVDRSSSEDVMSLPAFCYAPPMNSTINAKLVVTLDTGTGNDRVDINVGTQADESVVRFTTKLGTGDDSFALTSNYAVGDYAKLIVSVAGGTGNDFIDATFQGYVADKGLVDLLLDGDAGDDYLNTSFFNRVDGQFKVHQLGGDGDDDLNLNSHLTYDSTGFVDVVLDGELGNDTVTYSALGFDDPSVAHVLINGGNGYNIGKLSRDVTNVNLDVILWLPPMV